MFTTRDSLAGATTLRLPSTATTADTLHQPTTVGTATGIGFDVSQLAAQYWRYRIVAYGVRLRSVPGVNSSGEYTAAVFPAIGLAPTLSTYEPSVVNGDGTTQFYQSYWGATAGRNFMDSYLHQLGLPYSGGGNTAVVNIDRIVNYPQHATVSAAEVAARGVHMRGLPFDGAARSFRSMAWNANGTDAVDVGFSAVSSSGPNGAIQQFGVDVSAWRVGGHESMVLGGSGFAASTDIGTLEIIYHVEAVINPNYALLARPTSQAPSVRPSATLDQVLTQIHRVPRISFADVVTTVGDSLLGEIEGRAGAAAAKGLQSVAGMLARLTMASA